MTSNTSKSYMRSEYCAYKKKLLEVCMLCMYFDLVLKVDQILIVDPLVSLARVMFGLLWVFSPEP